MQENGRLSFHGKTAALALFAVFHDHANAPKNDEKYTKKVVDVILTSEIDGCVSFATLMRPPMRFPFLVTALGAAFTSCVPALSRSPVVFIPIRKVLPTASWTRLKNRTTRAN
jgi:hypothetical protein